MTTGPTTSPRSSPSGGRGGGGAGACSDVLMTELDTTAPTGNQEPLPPPPELSNLAKFKAAQDLRIETTNLPMDMEDAHGDNPQHRHHGTSSSGATGPVPSSSATSSSACTSATSTSSSSSTTTPQTPVPPSSTGKKRRRRTAAQIDRKFPCNYPGCTKAYGSEGSLTQHQRLKHRNQTLTDPTVAVAAAAAAANQLGSFFLPLQRTPRALTPGAASGVYRTSNGSSSSRAVAIRPATAALDPVRLPLAFDVPLLPTDPSAFAPPPISAPTSATASSTSSRQQLRARSNSMPVSFANAATKSPFQSMGATPRGTQSARRTRATTGSTPRPSKPPLRRNKCRSKSESLSELDPFVSLPGCEAIPPRPLMHDRSVSDSVGSSTTSAPTPLDWEAFLSDNDTSATGGSPATSLVDESTQAIDNDILSVLVGDCDTSDTGDSSMEFVGSPTFGSSLDFPDGMRSDMCGLESFAGFPGDVQQQQNLLGTNVNFREGHLSEQEWSSQQETLYLATHLEKMTMLQEGTSPNNEDLVANSTEHYSTSVDPYSGIVVDALAVPMEDEPNESNWKPVNSRRVKTEPQIHWNKDLAGAQAFTATDLDNGWFMDDVEMTSGVQSGWKPEKPPLSPLRPFGAGFNGHSFAEKHHLGGASGYGDLLVDVTPEYAIEEARLSSPVLCQRNDL